MDADFKKLVRLVILAFDNTPAERLKELVNKSDEFIDGFDPWEQLVTNAENVCTSETSTEGLTVKIPFPKQIGSRTTERGTIIHLHVLSVLIGVEEGEPPYVKDLKPC